MRARWWGVAGVGLGLVACGLTYAPGDFLAQGGVTTTIDAATPSPSAEAGPADATAPIDASGPLTRVVLFGGTRAPAAGETGTATGVNETIVTTLADDGTLGAWTFDEPPPQPGAWSRALLAGGKVYLEGLGVLAEATFGDHVTSPWTLGRFSTVPGSVGYGALVDPYRLHASSTFSTVQFSAALADDGSVGGWTAGTATSSVSRGDATIVRLGAFVYALAGRGGFGPQQTGTATEVERASYDADGGAFGNFTALADGGLPTTAFAPAVATTRARIVVAGGADSAGAPASAVVLAAQVADPTTGELAPWVTLPSLPVSLAGFALVVTSTSIVVFGGRDPSGAFHDEVLALAIHADGTFDPSFRQVGTLPGRRAGLAAVSF